jgi:hypothetical protein
MARLERKRPPPQRLPSLIEVLRAQRSVCETGTPILQETSSKAEESSGAASLHEVNSCQGKSQKSALILDPNELAARLTRISWRHALLLSTAVEPSELPPAFLQTVEKAIGADHLRPERYATAIIHDESVCMRIGFFDNGDWSPS